MKRIRYAADGPFWMVTHKTIVEGVMGDGKVGLIEREVSREVSRGDVVEVDDDVAADMLRPQMHFEAVE